MLPFVIYAGFKGGDIAEKNNAVYVFLSAVTIIAIFMSRMHYQRKLFFFSFFFTSFSNKHLIISFLSLLSFKLIAILNN